MDTTRRDVIALGAVLAGLGSSAGAAPPQAPTGLLEVLHVHNGPDGLSRARRVQVFGNKPIPVTQVIAGAVGPGVSDWGTARQKRFSINTQGELEVELGDGTRHHVGKGDLVFIADQGGKGHRSHMLTPVANLFLVVADDFDLIAWAAAGPQGPGSGG